MRYLKGEYVGESRDPDQILCKVLSRISKEDVIRIRRILMQDCPARLVLEEESKNKLSVIKKEINKPFWYTQRFRQTQ
jgi:hypothetical protein